MLTRNPTPPSDPNTSNTSTIFQISDRPVRAAVITKGISCGR